MVCTKRNPDRCKLSGFVLLLNQFAKTTRLTGGMPLCKKQRNRFVQQIVANGNKVICSHIDNGQDFYSYEPDEHWDVIVSNPPFTGKKKIFERALDLGKPFALICSATWFNDAAPVQIFLDRNREMQILMFDYRMRFLNNGTIDNKINFKSVYLCCDFLPRQIILELLDVPKPQAKVA